MLIPFLDVDPRKAASFVPNGHIQKLQQESWQLLFAAAWRLNTKNGTLPIKINGVAMPMKKPGYWNHPATVWVASSSWAWHWVRAFALALAHIEHPNRFPDKYDACGVRKETITRKRAREEGWQVQNYADKIRMMQLPFQIRKTAADGSDTLPCPLPSIAFVVYPNTTSHAQRAIEYRGYFAVYKNHARWQFLWETRPGTKRPAFMPQRTAEQEQIVSRWRSKLSKYHR